MIRIKSYLRPIATLAALAIRRNWRSGTTLLLIILPPTGMICLYLLTRGNETLGETAGIWLAYSAGWSVLLISIAALAMGAAAISLETSSQRLQLIKCKPPTSLQIWLGNWLGVMVLNLIVMTAAAVSISAGLGLFFASHQQSDEIARMKKDIITAVTTLHPEPVRPTPEGGKAGPVTVPPGGAARWETTIPTSLNANSNPTLQFEFITTRAPDSAPVSGFWIFQPESGAATRLSFSARPNQVCRLELPPGSFIAGKTLVIICVNLEDAHPTTILFPSETGIILKVPTAGAAANAVRAGVMLLARFAFLTALGITAGAAFTFPVALLAAVAMPLLDLLNRFSYTTGRTWMRWAFPGNTGQWPSRILDSAIASISELVRWIMPALGKHNPIDSLISGFFISTGSLLESVIILTGYTLLLAGIGVAVVARRQLALAAT